MTIPVCCIYRDATSYPKKGQTVRVHYVCMVRRSLTRTGLLVLLARINNAKSGYACG